MSPLAALRVAAGGVLAGALGAVVWWLVAPVAQVVIRPDGGFFVDPDPEQYAASDACFGLVALVLGVVVALLAWRLARREPLATVLGLAAGGLTGSVVQWRLGEWLGRVDLAAAERRPVGTVVSVPLRLQAGALLLVLPVAALATWLVVDLVSDYRSARAAAPVPGPAATQSWPDAAVTPDAPPPPPPQP